MKRALALALVWAPSVQAADLAAPGARQSIDPLAVGLFLLFVIITLVITKWAASKTVSSADFYTAGGDITPLQNGLAIAGDYMSAAAFLGLTAIIYTSGFDGMIYAIGFLSGWPIVTFLVAERLRNLGRYTFADVLSVRLARQPVRVFSAVSTLIVVAFYLIAQMVGAGQLIQLLFGLDYTYAVVIVGLLMMCYVYFGGMMATTWVQVIKAVMLLAGASVIALLTLAAFDFSFAALVRAAVAAHPKHDAILIPQALGLRPLSGLSLGLALMFGTSGLPHILMRFFTVRDARAARLSVGWATSFIGYFFVLVFVIGFGSIALVSTNPAYLAAGGLRGGGNMAAIHLAHAVGGPAMMGFISAVAFATILAVVSGLALSAASAVAHDLYAQTFRHGRSNEATEMKVSRIATLALGVLAIALGLLFRTQNVAYMVGLAFAIAASANFPLLLLTMYWRGLTTLGAIAGGTVGLVSALVLTIMGPSIWVAVLGHPAPLFPVDPPAILTIPLAFAVCYAVSILDRSSAGAQERAAFDAQNYRSHTGNAPIPLAAE